MVDARNAEEMKILVEDAAREIYFQGKECFPWSAEAIRAKEEKDEQMKQELKAKQKNLEFLTPSESCHIVAKEEKDEQMKQELKAKQKRTNK